MKRGLFLFLMIMCLLLCACDGAQSASTTMTTGPVTVPQSIPSVPTSPSTAPTVPSVPTEPTQSTTVPVSAPDPVFAQMPQVYCDFAEVYLTEHYTIFVFITAGMDASDTTVVTYDLQTDTLLGQISLGEDIYTIFPMEGNQFGVLSLSTGNFRVYDAACGLLSEKQLEGIEGEIGFAGAQGNMLLLSQLMTGEVLVYDLASQTVTETDLTPGVYQYVGGFSTYFLLESYEDGLIRVGFDGKSEILFKNGSAQVVGSTYAAGIRGDYITMLPVMGGDPLMAPCKTQGEMFVSVDGVGLLSRSQNWDSGDSLYYYATDSMTVTTVPVDGQVVGAGVADGVAVAVFRTDYSQPLQFMYVEFSEYDREAIGKAAYDNGILNGAEPLPEPAGSEETVALIQRYEQEYGIRVMYEPGFFDLEPLGYTLVPADEAAFMEKALLLESFLKFLPQGLLQEMGQKSPVVIFLCEDVHPTAGGLHTFLNGYNVLFLSVTGNDDYFLSVAAHEMAHALELGMNADVVAGWRELMPVDVRTAYERTSLTVEYTPDDKGRTPVWFLEAYSRTSEKEDRAVLFAALFDAWHSGDFSILQYEGLQIKANYWAEMLRATYHSCAEATFPWENG